MQIRACALRDIRFLSVTTAFALVLFAQVGFIVHLISFLDPVIGRASAATALALLAAMAVVGRVLFSTVIDRLNQRLASALSFLSQAAALVVLINFRDEWLLIAACARVRLLGRQSDHAAVADRAARVRRALVRRAGQPADRDRASHLRVRSRRDRRAARSLRQLHLPFYGCIALELIAAVLIMMRGRGESSFRERERSESRRIREKLWIASSLRSSQ